MDYEKTKKAIYFMFSSAFLVSIWAIFEHFGKSFSCLIFQDFGKFDVSCWVQDVQTRVFATFGQPNWLAAWIVAITPLTWSFILASKIKNQNSKIILWWMLFVMLFLTLIFTKSRSGYLGFGVAILVFWAYTAYKYIKENILKDYFYTFGIFMAFSLSLIAIFGTPWTPKLGDIINKLPKTQETQETKVQETKTYQGPALEVGGTESGQIRKIVWKGALEIWKNNPVFGTGVETFAFSYYKHRPIEHNLVSEWNFLYNKAHNEYLNFAATTGTVGLISYLVLIAVIIKLFIEKIKIHKSREDLKLFILNLALLSGFVSILITNFFGFSVVAVALLFFLFPAFSITLSQSGVDYNKNDKIGKPTNLRIVLITLSFGFVFFVLNSIYKYWYADSLYAQGNFDKDSGLIVQSRNNLFKATEYSPKESVFWNSLSKSTGNLAIYYAETGDMETARQIAARAVAESDNTISLSPVNVVHKRARVQMLVNLSPIDASYLKLAKITLLDATKLAPTDANIFYNLSLIYLRTGDIQAFVNTIKKTIEMKPNYKEARLALARYLISENEPQLAKNELLYILENISRDPETEKELENIEKKIE